jgi:hypothetical protein
LSDDLLFDMGAPAFDQRWALRRTNHETAASWFARYHYTGTRGGDGGFMYGIFAPDLIAVVNIAPAANCFGVARKYELERWPGNREISRVAVHPDAPANAASRCVAMVLDQCGRADGLEWVFSYADTGQNHHGGIYQALNAVYVGLAYEARPGYLWNGAPCHPRTVVSRLGTQAKGKAEDAAAAIGVELVRVEGMLTGKHTYILPCGGPRARRQIRRHLKQYRKPYPKRDDGPVVIAGWDDAEVGEQLCLIGGDA